MYEHLNEATQTFCAVRDSISPAEHNIAYRALWTVPMAFYWGRTVEECRELMFSHERDLLADKFDSDILKVATSQSLARLSVELRGK